MRRARVRVSVVLPVYRNRDQLPELHRRLTGVLEGSFGEHEIVYVEDCGDDGSREWLRHRRAGDPSVRVVEMAANAGQHRAILEGLRRAEGEIVVVMDADLQDPPEAVPRLVAALGGETEANGPSVVFARRTTQHQSRLRSFTGYGFKRIVRALVGGRIPPATGTFMAMSRPAVEAVVSLADDSPYIPLLVARTGSSLTTVPVEKASRPDSASAYTPMRRLRLAFQALMQALRWRLRRE